MGWLDALKRFASKPPAEPAETELIYIRLPEALEPLDRGAKYEDAVADWQIEQPRSDLHPGFGI